MSGCPCGSGEAFAACCGVHLAGAAAPTPEALMRSRYAAFVNRNAPYLLETWHPGTRPAHLDVDDATTWLGLTILDAPAVPLDATRGVVEFIARYRDADGDGELHERSRFVRQSGRWWYLDGIHS